MKTKSYIFICFSAILIVFTHKIQAQSKVKEKHHSHQKNEKINLNKGKKWKVDEKMMGYFRKMEKDLNEYDNSKDKDYNLLAWKLKESVNLLVSSCTMSGKAHDELHKWLVSYLDLVDKLNTSSEATSKDTYEKLKSSFTEFNTFFD